MNTPSLQNIEIYTSKNGDIIVDVRLSKDTVWLSLQQLTVLFERDKSVISRHIENIFKEKELAKKATVAKFATVQQEGKRSIARSIVCYNLDVIISIGYRVNSKQGVQFRQWASKILKDNLIKGYSVNHRRLTQESLQDMQNVISLVSKTLVGQSLVTDTGAQVLDVIANYCRTWDALFRFDHDLFECKTIKEVTTLVALTYEEAQEAIKAFKKSLLLTGEVSDLFGCEVGEGLKAILGNIIQTFDKKPLYPTNIDRAAHLLYLIIKDHPFTDGNKRIGSLLFLLYLKKSKLSLHKIPDNYLTALALLIAESASEQKSLLIKLITYMLS